MAHHRNRYLKEILDHALKLSPLVGVLGHRQVGKTTLVSTMSDHYQTFDDESLMKAATADTKGFIDQHRKGLTILDEVQLVPSLFPALKERVRVNKRPGQFLLTGSVRFTSKKAIRESLTGRILNFELLPFSVSETNHLPLPNSCVSILESKNLESTFPQLESHIKSTKKLMDDFDIYLERGGLPGITFVRNEKMRGLKVIEQLNTILDRDLRSISPTTLSGSQLLDYCRELSKLQGIPIKYSQLKEKTNISDVVQKRILFALEAIFVLRILPLKGDRNGFIVYFQDQAESLFLSENEIETELNLAAALFRNIRTQFAYRIDQNARYFQFLTRAGVKIPLAIETSKGKIGIIPIGSAQPNRAQRAGAYSFLKAFENAKIIYASTQFSYEIIDSRSVVLPISALV